MLFCIFISCVSSTIYIKRASISDRRCTDGVNQLRREKHKTILTVSRRVIAADRRRNDGWGCHSKTRTHSPPKIGKLSTRMRRKYTLKHIKTFLRLQPPPSAKFLALQLCPDALGHTHTHTHTFDWISASSPVVLSIWSFQFSRSIIASSESIMTALLISRASYSISPAGTRGC